MKIEGVQGMTIEQVQQEIQQGGKFVLYQYCISILVLTFRRNSPIYFIKHDTSSIGKGMRYTLISVLLGWWGIPWGPIYTISSLARNLGGGKDVTQEVMSSIINNEGVA